MTTRRSECLDFVFVRRFSVFVGSCSVWYALLNRMWEGDFGAVAEGSERDRAMCDQFAVAGQVCRMRVAITLLSASYCVCIYEKGRRYWRDVAITPISTALPKNQAWTQMFSRS